MNDWREQQRQRDEERRTAVLALPTLELRHHAAITGRRGEERVAASVGPDGQVVALWTTARDVPAVRATTTQPGWATFPDPRASRPVAARVSIHGPKPVAAVELADFRLAHVTVQPLSEGRILVVAARARWRPEGPDRNAVVYDADGSVVAEETLGDGIEHVFTTGSDRVWVGYFDEGVYGNYGWGGSDAPAPMGRYGLVRFSPDLRPEWHFPSHVARPWGAISDCYALNVAGETAWTCYYTGFPVVRVHDGAVTGWRNDVTGARALAVEGSRIALLGGHGPDRDRLTVGVLGGDRFHVTGQYRVVLPDGGHLPPSAQAVGRGPDLHVLTDDDWYRLDLEGIPYPG